MATSAVKGDLIKDIDDVKDTWRLYAKVLTKWTILKRTPPFPIWKLGLLLVDAEGNVIEAFTTQRSLFGRYLRELVDGHVYRFENFEVIENTDKYKVTNNSWKLSFHTSTYIDDSDIPICHEAFSFVAIEDLAEDKVDREDLIDVLGFLQAWGDLEDVKKENTTTKRLKFTIADINENSINVILYGDSATRTFNSKPDDLEPPIVVMVRFARILKGKAYGHITNQCEGTKAIFNPDIAEARSLCESLEEKPDASQSLSQISNCVVSTLPNESMLTFPCRMTISQIFQLKQKGEVVTKVTIQKLETFYGWYYDGCPCDKKPSYVTDSDKLTCPGCNKVILMTEPKFKVHYKVVDDTGRCSILLFNRCAMQLFGSSAAELRDEVCKDGEPGTFPEPLIKGVGKVIIVKLNVKDNNLNRPNSSISVSQLSDDPKIFEQFTYFYQSGGGSVISQSSPAESSGSKSSSKVHEAQTYEDNDLTISQFITPNYSQAKRRKELKSPSLEVESLGLSGMLTPDFSATKPTKTIKKEPK